jgi:quercetin dioxygenase-like cupin family protein
LGLIRFDLGIENLVTRQYSQGVGSVLRSERVELTRIVFSKGTGADFHQHPEEQLFYCVEGKLQVTLGKETYIVDKGEATWHPSNVRHKVHALEDTVLLSFKIRAEEQIYDATGELK